MKKSKGVTIVGVLIGIMILSIALAGQLKLLGNTVRREGDLRNLIVATSLAREGIEIAFTWRVSEGWQNLINHKNGSNDNYCPDIRNTKLSDLTASTHCLDFSKTLNAGSYSPNFKAYLYGIQPDGTYSSPPFARAVRIESCNDGSTDSTCLLIRSKVSWATGKEVEITKKIYNWYVP